MTNSLGFMVFDPPEVTSDEVHRFDGPARIQDREAFTATLNTLIREKVALASQAATAAVSMTDAMARKALALRADSRWAPTATDLQRGRNALLQAFEQPQNLRLPEFARLAGKSRQQIYKDISGTPRRLLALSVGPRGQRLPEWQLDPLRLRLTQEVLKVATDVDAWTLFHALSEPMDALHGRSPVDAVSHGTLEVVVRAVCDALGIHPRGAD